ncbi:MAG: hypothetical protein Q7U20_07820 [Caulobacter sp.]|nr:hypothetical protein [Caulobacter sp.]
MIAEQMRVPDLWLKRELALALVPPGKSVVRITNEILAQCVRGPNTGGYTLNKIITGDEAVRRADDLYRLAATLEFLVTNGAPEGFCHTHIDAFTGRDGEKELALWPNAILGTFGDFARALLQLVNDRPDFHALGGEAHFIGVLSQAVRQNLYERLSKAAELAGSIAVLSGRNERLIRQPSSEDPKVKVGDNIQLIIPSSPSPQVVFGFELRADDRMVLDPWKMVGSWFAPRFQAAGEALALLPVPDQRKHPYADGLGPYWIQVVGVEVAASRANAEPELPSSMSKLTKDRPTDWPNGYAEAMALVTFVDRESRKRRNATSTRLRLERNYHAEAAAEMSPIPPGIRLYRARYEVRSAHERG